MTCDERPAVRGWSRRFPSLHLMFDAVRPGATAIGWVFPVLLALVTIAVAVVLVGQVVVPWAIYPAL